jgi:hypothetical protein
MKQLIVWFNKHKRLLNHIATALLGTVSIIEIAAQTTNLYSTDAIPAMTKVYIGMSLGLTKALLSLAVSLTEWKEAKRLEENDAA